MGDAAGTVANVSDNRAWRRVRYATVALATGVIGWVFAASDRVSYAGLFWLGLAFAAIGLVAALLRFRFSSIMMLAAAVFLFVGRSSGGLPGIALIALATAIAGLGGIAAIGMATGLLAHGSRCSVATIGKWSETNSMP